MVVSQGFYKKLKDWIYSEQYRGIRFRPFQTHGNPYKSECFLVSVYPDTQLTIRDEEATLYAESLVDRELFQHLYGEQCDSKEMRAIQRFTQWYEGEVGSPLILTYLNSLQVNGLSSLKLEKKNAPIDYQKGSSSFHKVILEFAPKCIILHGNEAIKLFRQQFVDIMIDFHQTITSAKDLEEVGIFAEISLSNGEIVSVFGCRHMSNYSEQAMQTIKNSVKKIVKSER